MAAKTFFYQRLPLLWDGEELPLQFKKNKKHI